MPGQVDDPNDPDDDTFGTAVHHSVFDGRQHACGDQYDYAVVQIAENWLIKIDRRDNGLKHQFTQLDNKAFWDWYYRDYNAAGQCDYSQNCHGYAFGVGDWPDDAGGIMGYRDPNQFIPLGTPPHIPCYEGCSTKDAVIASNVSGHSIQVIGTECDLPEDSPIECEHAPAPGPPEPCKIEAIVFSAEQFRESGSYTRAVVCPDSLDVSLAHDRAGAILAAFARASNLQIYKKN